MCWKPYLNNRLIKNVDDQFYVIVPEEIESIVPLYCPICERLLRTQDDENSYLEYECCNFCALNFAHARKNEWKNGWRPTKEEVKERSTNFPYLSVTIDIDK